LVPDTGRHFESTFWFEAKSLRPLRRRLTTTIVSQPPAQNEIYEEFRLNLDLPDRKIGIPR